ncbi:AAA family ATPase [Ilumatobacter sp.]|uniref:AAA family ATPase n=1 Tax=Ilumatobacter sp. TaxID=1967498 RepID=UPI003C5E6C58
MDENGELLITMFGTLSVRSGSRFSGPADLGGVKPREILEILLLHNGSAVSKNVLAEHLWTDRSPQKVFATLESYVSVLRKRLTRLSPAAASLIVTGNGAYSIDRHAVTVDIDVFDRLRRQASDDTVHRIDLRARAMELATADLLLDAEDATWALGARELYRERVTRCGVQLARDLLSVGDADGAIAAAEQSIRFSPYAEEAYRLAMVANYSLGLDGVAQNVHQRCRTVVENGLGRDLTSATEDLAGSIDAGVAPRDLVSEIISDSAGTITLLRRSIERRIPASRLPFVGRSRELGDVMSSIERSLDGAGSLVVVRGAPGFGRTALLDAIARHQVLVDGTFAVGRHRYVEGGRNRPGVPLAEATLDAFRGGAIAGAAEDYGALQWLGLDSSFLAPLIALVERHGPLVLLLDDLQFADDSVMRCIELLVQQIHRIPLTIVATVSFPAMPNDTDLTALPGLPACTTIELGALDQETLDDLVDDLVSWTGGVPWLLADAWRWQRAGFTGPSPTMRHRVLSTVRGLDEFDRTLLLEATVRPTAYATAELAAAIGGDECSVRQRCEHLVERGLFIRTNDDYRFRAPLVNQIIVEAVGSQHDSVIAS